MSVLSYEEVYEGLIRIGIAPDLAAARARKIAGDSPPDPATRDARILEKAEQREVVKIFQGVNCKVRTLSQPRETMQSFGFPDLYVMHRVRPLAFWWETKRQVGGALSPAQEEFRDDCARCGEGWGSGDRYAAREYLRAQGFDLPARRV